MGESSSREEIGARVARLIERYKHDGVPLLDVEGYAAAMAVWRVEWLTELRRAEKPSGYAANR